MSPSNAYQRGRACLPHDRRGARLMSGWPRLGWVAAGLVPLLAGCVHEPAVTDPPFGQSVRHMILVQTTDPEREPLGLDGEKALNVLETYRSGGDQVGGIAGLGGGSGGGN